MFLLEKNLGPLDFIETPLADIGEYIHDNCGLELRFDDAALERAGTSKHAELTPTYLRPGGMVLEELLQDIHDKLWITYRYDGGLRITLIPDEPDGVGDIVIKYYVGDLVRGAESTIDGPDLVSLLKTVLASSPRAARKPHRAPLVSKSGDILVVTQNWPGHVTVLNQLLDLSGVARRDLVYAYVTTTLTSDSPDRVTVEAGR
jgi:hypothetical protein